MIIPARVLPRLSDLHGFASLDAGFADMDKISIDLELKLVFYGTPFVDGYQSSIWFDSYSFARINDWSDLADMLMTATV